MIGDRIRDELNRPLEGDRMFLTLERGPFTLREHPEHIARIRAEKARLAVEEDLRNYRRLVTMTQNAMRFS